MEWYFENQDKWQMPKKVETPMTVSDRPELDVTHVLSSTDTSCYMSLIGIIWWMLELGRVGICLEVSMMYSHMAMPR